MQRTITHAAGVLLAAVLTTAAGAQEQAPYVDDRSTPEAVIQSYYSAINRHEYARAYSYFGRNTAPEYDGWESGYARTGEVGVSFGQVAQEGAAGSIYYTLPVTLDVTPSDGGPHRFFTGCYQLRLAQPTNQTPPFEGIHIESGDLHPGGTSGFAPAKCG